MLKLNHIKQKANYLWRVGATGFSFASFGIGGVAIGGLVAPLVNLSTQNQSLRQQRTQNVIRYSFKGFTEMMVKLGIMTYEIEGLEKLQKSRQELIIANHPTLVDVMILNGTSKLCGQASIMGQSIYQRSSAKCRLYFKCRF